MTDSYILSAIGAAILLLLGIAGFFIKRWMDKTEQLTEHSSGLIEKTNLALQALNLTMTNINNNLLMYQMKVDTTIDNIKTNIDNHKNIYIREKKMIDRQIETHDNDIQDLNIRVTVIEKTKL